METVVKSDSYQCSNCKKNLAGQRYILKDELSYCIACYEELFANICSNCENTIGTDSKDLSFEDKHWHEKCFKCVDCNCTLVEKFFGTKNELIYCESCYDEKFGEKCDQCRLVFKSGTKKLEWNGSHWHEKCFLCVNCSKEIGSNSFIPKEGQQYCVDCFNNLFAPKCSQCKEPIMAGGVLYRNEPFHRDCFNCTGCKKNLYSQKFTSRENQPFCAECFGENFAKKCCKCTKPITGFGQTKFISFDERHWHNDCFTCDGPSCGGINLVGQGFITDKDQILCPDCAKLPYASPAEKTVKEQIAV